jgi:hypothetical protein
VTFELKAVQAFQAATAIDAGGPFFGKGVVVFLFSAVTFNYALAFLSNGLSMAISLRSMSRYSRPFHQGFIE